MILACDTSSSICSVALVQDQEVVQKWETTGAQVHIEKLTPFLKEALTHCNSSKTVVDALALSIGPGSFNGLRIGLATVKGLALTRNLPIIPVPSLDALALNAENNLRGRCRGVIFSHRNLVHYADYQLGAKAPLQTPDFSYTSWDDLYEKEIDHYFGDVERGYGEWLKTDAGQPVQDRYHNLQADAGYIGLLAEQRLSEASQDLDQLEPLYNAKYVAQKWIPPQF